MALLTPDVEPLWIARYDYEAGWQLPLHAHAGYFQLIFVQDGTGEALLKTSRVSFHAGQLLFIRPGLAHGLTANLDSTVRTLDTKFRIRLPALRRACLTLESFHPVVDPRIVTLLELMLTEARAHGVLTAEFCQALFTQLLLVLLKREFASAEAKAALAVRPPGDHDLCARLERYLRENCAQRIDQPTLAAAMHYSYRHLHATWRSRHRLSPLQSLWIFRIERASHLIRYSDYDLKHIAELTGFASVHHFTRVFTRVMGAAPARWRERERGGIRQDVVINPSFINPALTIQGTGAGRASDKQRR